MVLHMCFSHNYARIKAHSCHSLLLEKTMTFYNVIILIKLVFNKDKSNNYYNTFLETCSYKWYNYAILW